jgi:aminoglycoside 6'-N-acetyltransferase
MQRMPDRRGKEPAVTVELSFRPLAEDDFGLFAGWLARPHVQRWWREPATVEHVSAEYGACARGDLTTRVYVVNDGELPIGIIQVFRISDYPEYFHAFPRLDLVSIDYLIGEVSHIGRGVGTLMIEKFVADVVRPLYPDAAGVSTSAETDNPASLGALRKAGFVPGDIITGEYGTPERIMTMIFPDGPRGERR